MFRTYNCDDAFNLKNLRNMQNTEKRKYNCAGFALETYSWYCPHRNDWASLMYSSLSDAEVTEQCVQIMLEDFKDLRIITDLSELKDGEYAIAFRISRDYEDFHFARRMPDGKWYNKMGGSFLIEEMDEHEVFHEEWDRGYYLYDGPVVLMAKIEKEVN